MPCFHPRASIAMSKECLNFHGGLGPRVYWQSSEERFWGVPAGRLDSSSREAGQALLPGCREQMVSERPVHRSHGSGRGSWLELWPRHGEGSRQEQGRILARESLHQFQERKLAQEPRKEKRSSCVGERTQVQRAGCRSNCVDQGVMGHLSFRQGDDPSVSSIRQKRELGLIELCLLPHVGDLGVQSRETDNEQRLVSPTQSLRHCYYRMLFPFLPVAFSGFPTLLSKAYLSSARQAHWVRRNGDHLTFSRKETWNPNKPAI